MNPDGQVDRPVRDVVVLWATAAAVASFLLAEIYDLDVFWNVAIGHDILTRREIPRFDRYSAAGLGHPYLDIHWLFQVAAALCHGAAGWVGVQLLTVTVWTLALATCYRATARWAPLPTSAVLVFLAAMASAERFIPRPEIVTFLMLAIFYERLQAGRYRSPRDVALLGLLQIVWASAHGLFVLGPFLAGCVLVEEMIERLRGSDSARPALAARLLAVLAACSVLTPHGLRTLGYAWLLVTQVGPNASPLMKSLGELSPVFGPAFRSSPAFWFFVVLLLAAAAAAVAGAFRRTLPVSRSLMVAGMGAVALTGRRNVVLFALVAAPFVAEQASLLVPGLLRGLRRSRLTAAAAAVAMFGWAIYPLSGRYYLKMEVPARIGLGTTPSFFPYGIPSYLDSIGFSGQVYNSNTIGGFYLFHCFPRRLPLTEGRWVAYDDEVVSRILDAPRNPDLWRWVLDTYRIDALLLQHASPESRALVPRLPRDREWRLVRYDHAASLWLREGRPGLPPAINLERGLDLPAPPRVEDCIMLDLFLLDAGALVPRIRNLERAAAFGWRRETFLEALGGAQIEARRFEDAEKTFDAVRREDPRNTRALNELAYLAVRRGDKARAEALLLHALELEPENPDLRANYERLHDAAR